MTLEQASAHLLCSGEGGGRGGLFNSRGASLGQISILKIIIFLMMFLSFFGICSSEVIFWYIHMMIDDASLNDTN